MHDTCKKHNNVVLFTSSRQAQTKTNAHTMSFVICPHFSNQMYTNFRVFMCVCVLQSIWMHFIKVKPNNFILHLINLQMKGLEEMILSLLFARPERLFWSSFICTQEQSQRHFAKTAVSSWDGSLWLWSALQKSKWSSTVHFGWSSKFKFINCSKCALKSTFTFYQTKSLPNRQIFLSLPQRQLKHCDQFSKKSVCHLNHLTDPNGLDSIGQILTDSQVQKKNMKKFKFLPWVVVIEMQEKNENK